MEHAAMKSASDKSPAGKSSAPKSKVYEYQPPTEMDAETLKKWQRVREGLRDMETNGATTFRTKKGNECSVTNTQVTWNHNDGSVYRVLLRDITSVHYAKPVLFRNAHTIFIDKFGAPHSETTDFATESEALRFMEAIKRALMNQ